MKGLEDLLIGFEVEFASNRSKDLISIELNEYCHFPKPLAFEHPYNWRTGRRFHLTEDASINCLTRTFHHELITGPVPFFEGLESLQSILNYLDLNNDVTNSTTGLHVNISHPSKKLMENIDRVELIARLPELAILKEHGRLRNRYCQPFKPKIVEHICSYEMKNRKTSFSYLDYYIHTNSKKYRSVNFGKLQSYVPYLEYRMIGGRNYHRKYSLIEKEIYNIATGLLNTLNVKEQEKIKYDYFSKYMKGLGIIYEGLIVAHNRKLPVPLLLTD